MTDWRRHHLLLCGPTQAAVRKTRQVSPKPCLCRPCPLDRDQV